LAERQDMLSLLYGGFAFFAVFSATFSSDKTVGGVPAFYLAWAGVVAIRAVKGIGYKRLEFVAQCLLAMSLLPAFLSAQDDFSFYYNAYLFAVLYINVLFVLPWLIRQETTPYLAFAGLSAWAVFGLRSILSGEVRTYIIFGPNVLYRIYAFLFLLLCISFIACFDRKLVTSVMFWLGLVFLVLGMAATGSKGAVVVLVVLLIVYGSRALFRKNLKGALGTYAALFSVAYVVSGLFGDYIRTVFGRLLDFSLATTSAAWRAAALRAAPDFLTNEQGLPWLIGQGPENRYTTFYPHNVLVESTVYGGFWLLSVNVIALVALAIMLFSKENLSQQSSLILLGVIVGSFFSGSLLYNYPVFSVGFVALAWLLFSVSQALGTHSGVARPAH